MTTRLTNTARTLLRSRVRRHPDLAQQFAGDVAALSNADLVQLALMLRLDTPTDAEAQFLEQVKAGGAKGKSAIRQADALAVNAGLGGAGLQAIINAEGAAPVSTFADDDNDDDDDDTDEADDTEAEAEADAPKADADPVAAKVEAEFADLQQRFGACMAVGDMRPYQEAVREVLRRANAPAPVAAAPARTFDPSKVKGHIPQVVAKRTRKEAGIDCANLARPDATAFEAYDAPDAPPVDPGYIWPDLTDAALVALATGENVFLWGPAGTGKSSFAEQIAARYGRPFATISCDDQTDGPTLVGMTGLDGQGGMAWRDGQLAAAIRRPGTVILVDEPSVARPGALAALHSVLAHTRALNVSETGETIPVAPGVVFILADNTNGTGDETGQYEATRRLNRATLDRMAVTIRVDYLPPDVEAKTLSARTGIGARPALALAKFAALTRRAADGGDLSHGLGLRRLLAMAKLIHAGINPAAAFQVSVLETVPHDDREPLRQMFAADLDKGAL